MRDLVTIGKPAVLPLCREFELTDQQRMMRRLAFALRAIGDPRAVPTLIRVLPKTLQPPQSDYGLIVEDDGLVAFMRKHGVPGGREHGRYFSFRRPVRETYHALTHLTNRNLDGRRLCDMHRAVDRRRLARQERLYHAAAREWADWWEANWQRFDVDASFSKVELPAYTPPDLSDYPTGRGLTANATMGHGSSGNVLSPIGDPDRGADFFLDLDTGSRWHWPTDLPVDDSSAETVRAARQWAADQGADLMCLAMPDEQGKVTFTLAGIDLQLWEIDPLDAQNIDRRVRAGRLPEGRPVPDRLLHYDPQTGRHYPQPGSSFLYVTREQGLGTITITDFVTRKRDLTGMPSGMLEGVGFHRGVRFDYRCIAR
jgi:hypothetical protein